MMNEIKSAIIPHLIGIAVMFCGWYLSIVSIALQGYQQKVLFSKETGFGFLIILVGAYIPGLYLRIKDKFKK